MRKLNAPKTKEDFPISFPLSSDWQLIVIISIKTSKLGFFVDS